MPKIYRVSANDVPAYYCASGAAAGKHRKYLNTDKKIPRAEIVTDEIEYASGKAGVIELLNKLEGGQL